MMERVNLNEELQVALLINANPDTLMFSQVLIYEQDNFPPTIYEYNIFRCKLWYQLAQLAGSESVTLRFSVYDPRFIMPS